MDLDKNGETDEELLERYAQGESAAFELFFLRHKNRVYHYALRKVHHPESAADIVQDVFVKLHARIHQYRKGERALSWFFAIVHNACLDEIRKFAVRKRSLQGAEDTQRRESQLQANQPDWHNSADELSESLEQLSDVQRLVVEKRIIDEKSFRQISDETGKNEATLRKIYSRAVEKLRLWFVSRDEGEGGK
ncbi:MAG: hypothetical protein RLZZ488_2198 [Pseudomonadota bacterium]|jgi:RNA polymerase sigma-70 factor (ECF subfamily)